MPPPEAASRVSPGTCLLPHDSVCLQACLGSSSPPVVRVEPTSTVYTLEVIYPRSGLLSEAVNCWIAKSSGSTVNAVRHYTCDSVQARCCLENTLCDTYCILLACRGLSTHKLACQKQGASSTPTCRPPPTPCPAPSHQHTVDVKARQSAVAE